MTRPIETREHRLKRLAATGGWIAVDFDGTIAQYTHWRGPYHMGEPIPKMVERVKAWLAAGVEVRIMTARADDQGCVMLIRQWCDYHVGQELAVTNKKDYKMIEIWDDRAVQVEQNTGRRMDGAEE